MVPSKRIKRKFFFNMADGCIWINNDNSSNLEGKEKGYDIIIVINRRRPPTDLAYEDSFLMIMALTKDLSILGH